MNKYIHYNNKTLNIFNSLSENTDNQSVANIDALTEVSLKKLIEDFLHNETILNLSIYCKDQTKAFDRIKNHFYFIEAAGGLIKNNNKYLFIKRLGKWDLPKGKLDKGESNEEAAIRECEEECNVKGLRITGNLNNTYHIYEYKKGFALKVTYWFAMETEYNEELIPQTEENIEEVKWMDLDEIKSVVLKNTYITIEMLVKEFFNLK